MRRVYLFNSKELARDMDNDIIYQIPHEPGTTIKLWLDYKNQYDAKDAQYITAKWIVSNYPRLVQAWQDHYPETFVLIDFKD